MLLDPSIDTAAAFSDGSVTVSIAKAVSFRGAALIVPTGVDAGLIAVALRGRGIFVEGPIPVPAAAAAQEAHEAIGDVVEEQAQEVGRSFSFRSPFPG